MVCPICKGSVNEPGSGQPRGFFPFCSERCQLIDLGRWLGGKYQIPVDDPDTEGCNPDQSGDERRPLLDE